ncbi:phage antirepressor N-terminal domain-containing protein [Patescibacteria group bacterium]|nr:phage antirepressor N-terminal domain-containing protein [Patescibacteria group bacterium]MBU1703691.1 phage antirepressor N-terminal domain-containing protein [Patescibacteria group bacterium]MBU1953662.1 phage antirepressor N-terminal domain-containing protein [Patescibacteria group bacterium]
MQGTEIRYQALLKNGNNEDDSNRIGNLIEQAQILSRTTDLTLRNIVGTMANYAFTKAKLLPDEFMRIFIDNSFATVMIAEFLGHHLEDEGATGDTEPDEEQTRAFRSEMQAFIQGYPEGGTLSDYVSVLRKKYPGANFTKGFDNDLQHQMVLKINQETYKLVPKLYELILHEMGASRFILDYLFHRVIKINGKKIPPVNKENLGILIQFLVDTNYQLDDLYILLFEEMHRMDTVHRERKETHNKIAAVHEDVHDQDFNPMLFGDEFDFDKYFHAHFSPIIKDVRSREMPSNLRLGDVIRLRPDQIAESILPDRMWDPIRALVDDIAEEKKYMKALREIFNFDSTPQATITDKEVIAILEEHLRESGKQIAYTIREGLRMRHEEDQIHKDCEPLGEIVECNDLRKLLIWLAYPNKFREELKEKVEGDPKYKETPDQIIRHQILMRLILLHFYREHAFEEKFRVAQGDRKLVEDHLIGAMEMKNLTEVCIGFRIRMEIDPDTQEPVMYPVEYPDGTVNMEPHYEILDKLELKHQQYFNESQDTTRQTIIVKENGKSYKIFPLEEKKFIEAKVSSPGTDKRGRRLKKKATVYVYSGDKNIIHAKGLQSYLSSILRGKKPSDLLRWAVATTKEKDAAAIRRAIYDRYYTSGNVTTIDDSAEDRHINNKPTQKGIKSTSTNTFRKKRYFDGSVSWISVERDKNGMFVHRPIVFETMILDMATMLIYYLSDHTVTSHSRVYTPEREFDSLFKFFFPPALYGKEYAVHKIQGFRHEQPMEVEELHNKLTEKPE